MRIDIITLFPELCEAVMGESIVGRAQEMGAQVVKKTGNSISEAILDFVQENKITTVCIGKPHHNFFQQFFRLN